ncbi:MAG: hypothetical protein JST31_09255 [Actinobacteria bacterium]|nr:hypothetical protein [Actinomycetota bacterium]
MPRILIVTDPSEDPSEVVYAEQVVPAHLQSEHSGRLLVERLAWAVEDARRAERRLDSRARGHRVDRTSQQQEERWIRT